MLLWNSKTVLLEWCQLLGYLRKMEKFGANGLHPGLKQLHASCPIHHGLHPQLNGLLHTEVGELYMY